MYVYHTITLNTRNTRNLNIHIFFDILIVHRAQCDRIIPILPSVKMIETNKVPQGDVIHFPDSATVTLQTVRILARVGRESPTVTFFLIKKSPWPPYILLSLNQKTYFAVILAWPISFYFSFNCQSNNLSKLVFVKWQHLRPKYLSRRLIVFCHKLYTYSVHLIVNFKILKLFVYKLFCTSMVITLLSK